VRETPAVGGGGRRRPPRGRPGGGAAAGEGGAPRPGAPRAARDSVWSRCSSWYRQADGRVTTNWPRLGVQYKQQVRFDADDYEPA
jgi:hypothetical protein